MTDYATARKSLVVPMTAVMIFGLMLSTTASANYLSDLEAEAKTQENISNGVVKEVSNYKPDSATDGSLHTGLNRTGFEENLQRSSLGSYHMFSKLNSTQQEQVYKAYQDGASLKELKRLIRKLYTPF